MAEHDPPDHDDRVDPGDATFALEEAAGVDELDVEMIEREELQASRRASSIEAGRRKAGTAGAAMAGAMLAIQEIYEGPPKDDIVVEVEASGEPGDIDTEGIEVRVGDVDVWAPPPAADDAASGDESAD